ncbi:hypothetical protein JCM10908_000057 [Rhodotorula pacifica]|uniref:uncharacterized protein n=1 Tax=Rhodotorula pacifica TaxID=1495444 RepID=UPI0031777F1C
MTTTIASRTALTLQLLPRDVKLLLVDFIAVLSRPSLFQLSLVNKEWHALVEPKIWAILRISPRPIHQLAFLALELLPRIGKYVHELVIENWSHCVHHHHVEGPHPPTSAAQQEVAKYEDVLRLSESTTLSWNERTARIQSELLAQALRPCIDIWSIGIDESLAMFVNGVPSISLLPPKQVAQSRIPNQVYPALQHIGTNIREVRLRLDEPTTSLDLNEVTRLIGSFPGCWCLRLELHAFGPRTWTSADRRSFLEAINSLKELRALCMTSCSGFDQALLENPQIPLPVHLRQLAIYQSPFSLRALLQIGDLCGQHLVELLLSDLNERGNVLSFGKDNVRPVPAKFTALERLLLETDFDASVLALFANSPLRSIDLRGEYRGGVKSPFGAFSYTINALQFLGIRDFDRPTITADEMRRFLVAHKSTLKTAHVSEHLIKGTDLELDMLDRWFNQNHLEGGLYHAC